MTVPTSLAALLVDAVSVLEHEGAAYALVGGLAVSVRTEPRFTRDIDIAVAVEGDAEAEALVGAFAPALRPTGTVEHHVLGRLASVRLAYETEAAPVIDLLFASSGIEDVVVRDAEPVEVFEGTTLPVARVGHLMALKILAVDESRPQDEADLVALRAVADAAELDRARSALQLIDQRGAGRGRDLEAAMRRVGLMP